MQFFSSNVLEKSVTISWATISTAFDCNPYFLTKSSLPKIAAAAPSDVGLIVKKNIISSPHNNNTFSCKGSAVTTKSQVNPSLTLKQPNSEFWILLHHIQLWQLQGHEKWHLSQQHLAPALCHQRLKPPWFHSCTPGQKLYQICLAGGRANQSST